MRQGKITGVLWVSKGKQYIKSNSHLVQLKHEIHWNMTITFCNKICNKSTVYYEMKLLKHVLNKVCLNYINVRAGYEQNNIWSGQIYNTALTAKVSQKNTFQWSKMSSCLFNNVRVIWLYIWHSLTNRKIKFYNIYTW